MEQEEKNCIEKGYKFLGWQVHSGNCDDIKKCKELGHRTKEVSHTPTGSDNTLCCDECKMYWKIDCSG